MRLEINKIMKIFNQNCSNSPNGTSSAQNVGRKSEVKPRTIVSQGRNVTG